EPPAATTATAAASTPAPVSPVPVSEPPEVSSTPWVLGAFLRGGAGSNLDRPRFAGTFDVSIAVVDPLRAVIGAGAAGVPPGRRGPVRIRYVSLLARAGAAIRPAGQPWEARLLGGIESYFVDGAAVDLTTAVLPMIET